MTARQIALGQPCRIQRLRKKGWRAPDGAVYVGRGTRYGNPWAVTLDRVRGWRVHPADDASVLSDRIVGWWESRYAAHENAVYRYAAWLADQPELLAAVRTELAGRDLMCWCPEAVPCHVDVLLAAAAGEDPRPARPVGP